MAQPSAGRQSATRWLQLSRVALSEATRRRSWTGRMRIAPRPVAAESESSARSITTGSSGSRMNSAMALKVLRLQAVDGSSSCAARTPKRSVGSGTGCPLAGELGTHLQHRTPLDRPSVGHAHAAENAEPRSQEATGVLVMVVEEV